MRHLLDTDTCSYLISGFDTLIAAHVLALNLTLITHNVRHFETVPGLRLEDWVNG